MRWYHLTVTVLLVVWLLAGCIGGGFSNPFRGAYTGNPADPTTRFDWMYAAAAIALIIFGIVSFIMGFMGKKYLPVGASVGLVAAGPAVASIPKLLAIAWWLPWVLIGGAGVAWLVAWWANYRKRQRESSLPPPSAPL